MEVLTMRKLSKIQDYKTPCKLYIIVGYEKQNGNRKPIYEEAQYSDFMASVKSFGGTEINENGRIKSLDTIEVKCDYRPDIKNRSRIELLETGEMYEIIGKPENVDQANVELYFKCEAVM